MLGDLGLYIPIVVGLATTRGPDGNFQVGVELSRGEADRQQGHRSHPGPTVPSRRVRKGLGEAEPRAFSGLCLCPSSVAHHSLMLPPVIADPAAPGKVSQR